MAIQWKRNSRYPSVTKPGVFPRIQEFDDFGVDILEDTWFELTGIDEQEMNKFKFSLGTWVQTSRRNRRVRILSADAVNTVTYPITDNTEGSGTTEPKPDYKPEGFLNDLSPFEWAKGKSASYGKLQTFTDGDVTQMISTADTLDPDYKADNWVEIGGGPKVKWLKPTVTREKFERHVFGAGRDVDGVIDIKSGQSRSEYYPIPNLEAHNRIRYYAKTFWTINYRLPFAGRGDHDVKVGMITEDYAWVCYATEAKNLGYGTDFRYKWKPNITHPRWVEDNKLGTPSPGFQWFWLPSNNIEPITDSETGLEAHGEWIEGEGLVQTQNQASSKNQYVGLVTKTPISDVKQIQQQDLFLYHEIGSDEYQDISSPLEVYFSLNYLERDPDPLRSLDKIRYLVLEWGDEPEKISDEDMLNSEFFYLYETDDSVFDGTKYKKLCLLAENAKLIYDEEIGAGGDVIDRGDLESHVYIEPGIKTIKTIVMRFDETNSLLLETSLVHTNIFIADPNQTIQDFNIFGGQDFTVLPLEKKLEPIIGNVDRRSEYVRSVEKIRDNDLYESSDYLEKLYADQFLPNIYDELYGKYAGNIDLGVTRVFKKPYDIFDFIGADKLDVINNNFQYDQDSLPLNSSATEILISNKDCVVNLDPSDQTNAQIENNGISDEKGLLMGDYRLVKNPEQQIRREGGMATPKINTQNKKQAF